MSNLGGNRNVELAKAIATWAHTGQVDKNGYDYIDHPKAVYYRIFADDSQDYDGQIVAWLHDVVEDTKISLRTLTDFFPGYIIDALEAITKIKDEKPESYYARVKSNPIALRVKKKDIEHNTSWKRLEKLPATTALRLRAKYAFALKCLEG